MRIKTFTLKCGVSSFSNLFYCPSNYINKEKFVIYPGEYIILTLEQSELTNIYSWPITEHCGELVSGQLTILIKNIHKTKKISITKHCQLKTVLRKQYIKSQEFYAPLHILTQLIDTINNIMCYDENTPLSE